MSIQWREENGLIFLPVTTHGLSGSEWKFRLAKAGACIDVEVERLLLPQTAQQTSQFDERVAPASFHEAVIVKGFKGRRAQLIKLRQEKKWRLVNPEVACSLREVLTDEDLQNMGLQWLTIESEPLHYWYRYTEVPTCEHNLLLSLNRHGAFKDTGEKNHGAGKHLSVSYTDGICDSKQGHLFLC